MNELDERSKKILWAIIQGYIDTSGPVGSRTVMKKYSLGWSPATIRNIMADLEELGYILQPHTSAGRVPTVKGYRVYVNSLLQEIDVITNKKLFQNLADKLHLIETDINQLVKEASRTLSTFSHYLGVATVPITENIIIEHIEFIKYRHNKIFCILISKEGIVKNNVITLEEKILTQNDLAKISRYLKNELKGLTLRAIRTKVLSQMSAEKIICDNLIDSALALCKKALAWETENIFYSGGFSGASNLPDFATMKQIKQLFRAIEEKHLIIKLLDKITEADGVQVFIGSENTLSEMKELSFVASTYNDGYRILGTLGVIGPTRMNYEEVIPLVSHTAKALTQIFSEK